jgi:hypothetical protein
MSSYLESYSKFAESKPLFETAKLYTEQDRYLEVLGYYISFAQSGKNITMLRYNASQFLKYIAENLSKGAMDNVTSLLDKFNLTEDLYRDEVQSYDTYKDQIDGYLFFNEIREE